VTISVLAPEMVRDGDTVVAVFPGTPGAPAPAGYSTSAGGGGDGWPTKALYGIDVVYRLCDASTARFVPY
jgi:hypothetical protein